MNWNNAIEKMKQGHPVHRVSQQHRTLLGHEGGLPIYGGGTEATRLAAGWTDDERPVLVFQGAGLSGHLAVDWGSKMGLIEDLAHKAVDCMLAQLPITVMHPAGWQRDGFPLPIKRVDPSPDGSTTQCYRPIVVLEWVDEKMAAAAKPVKVAPAGDVDDLFGI